MKPIIPTADAILRPALERMYTLRPRSFEHLNYRSGRYWHPFLGFRAQTARLLKLLSQRVDANRLKTATGQDLIEYVASEFSAIPDPGATFAIGEATLTRTTSTVAGDVRKGTKITRRANLETQMPLQAAEYEILADVHFNVGQTVAGPFAVRATITGENANHPIRTDSVPHGVVISTGSLFDKTITVTAFSAAGGSTGVDDPYVRRYARAYNIGQYGPTEAASRYGALSATGVRNLLAYDVPGTGTERVLVADVNWASSTRWAKTVEQSLYDNDLVGFGCKVECDVVRNKVVSIECNVALRDINYARETTELDIATRAAVQNYLDNRVDWNVWKAGALQGAISRAHPKIFNCTSLVMRDTAGNVVPEITSPDYALEQFHYALSNGAVKATYSGPG